jgi:hypothetical protein
VSSTRAAIRTRSSRSRAWRCAAAAAAAALALVAAAPSPARAAEDDGVYGRFDGDLELHAGAGVAIADGGPMLAAHLDALYLSTAGIYGRYTDALGTKGPSIERSIAAGLTIQPLFLGRYAKNMEQGPARLDLFLDSIALDLGAFWHGPRQGDFAVYPGLEVALGLSLPILAQADGPVVTIRGALRWRAADLSAAGAEGDLIERGAHLAITLAWHQIVRTHLVDAGDRLKR